MTEAYPADSTGSASRYEGGDAAAPVLARWLGLAAAPTFGIMALLVGLLGGGPMSALCATGHESALSGMFPMYSLMSAFHLAPWLNLASSRRSGTHRSRFSVRQIKQRRYGVLWRERFVNLRKLLKEIGP